MILEIGNIPYTDSDESKDKAGKAAAVYVVSSGRSYTIKCPLTPKEVPFVSGDLGKAIEAGRKFINSNKGSNLKKHIPCRHMGVRGDPVGEPLPYKAKFDKQD